MDLIIPATSSSAATQARAARRQRWLRYHGCKELIQDLDAGRLPFRTALRLAHLSPVQQRRELARRQRRVWAQELAALIIDRFLAQPDEDRGTLDLGIIRERKNPLVDHEGVKIEWDLSLFAESRAELTDQAVAAKPIGIAPESATLDSTLSGAAIDPAQTEKAAEPQVAATSQPKKNTKPKIKRCPGAKRVLKPTPLGTDAPTPHTNTLIQKNGAESTARALEAWGAVYAEHR